MTGAWCGTMPLIGITRVTCGSVGTGDCSVPMKKGDKKQRTGGAPDRGMGILKCRICGKPYSKHEIKRCEAKPIGSK